MVRFAPAACRAPWHNHNAARHLYNRLMSSSPSLQREAGPRPHVRKRQTTLSSVQLPRFYPSSRFSSASSIPPPNPHPPPASFPSLFSTATAVLGTLTAVDLLGNDGRITIPTLYWLIDHPGMVLLRSLDPETAHDWAIWALSKELVPANHTGQEDRSPPSLEVSLWDGACVFPNPVGVAAGFDKHAQAVKGLLGLGLGFVEVGSVTPRPQDGNPKPRMFRLEEDRAVINRYGFNSHGVAAVKRRLQDYWEGRLRADEEGRRKEDEGRRGLVGVNVGKNKTTEKAEEDYVLGVRELAPYADYLVVNVSSPNTPGLRSLQRKGAFQSLIQAVQRELNGQSGQARGFVTNVRGRRVPLLIKVAPDLTEEEKKDIAAVALKTGIDGLIVSNTTVSRPPSLRSRHAGETGGLSGLPLKELATQTIRDFYRLTGYGQLPIIGVGGIGSGQDAYDKIQAGASLVQVYSMLVYEGPGAVKRITRELAALLERDGYTRISDAVGAAHRSRQEEPHILTVDLVEKGTERVGKKSTGMGVWWGWWRRS